MLGKVGSMACCSTRVDAGVVDDDDDPRRLQSHEARGPRSRRRSASALGGRRCRKEETRR